MHFIRRLPELTDDEIARMEALNPKTSEEWREEEARRHVPGGNAKAPTAAPAHKHDGSKK